MPITIEELTSDPRYEKLSFQGKIQTRDRYIQSVFMTDERFQNLSEEGKTTVLERVQNAFNIQPEPSTFVRTIPLPTLGLPPAGAPPTTLMPKFEKPITGPEIEPSVLSRPIFEIPPLPMEVQKEEGIVPSVGFGVVRGLNEMITPSNLGLLIATGLTPAGIISRLVSGGFGVLMGTNFAKTILEGRFSKAIEKKNAAEASEIATELLISAVGAKGGIKGAFGKPTIATEVKPELALPKVKAIPAEVKPAPEEVPIAPEKPAISPAEAPKIAPVEAQGVPLPKPSPKFELAEYEKNGLFNLGYSEKDIEKINVDDARQVLKAEAKREDVSITPTGKVVIFKKSELAPALPETEKAPIVPPLEPAQGKKVELSPLAAEFLKNGLSHQGKNPSFIVSDFTRPAYVELVNKGFAEVERVRPENPLVIESVKLNRIPGKLEKKIFTFGEEVAKPEREPILPTVEKPVAKEEVLPKIKRQKVTILPNKESLIAEIKQAIDKIKQEEEVRTRTGKLIKRKEFVKFKIDGGAKIVNTMFGLSEFLKKIEKLPESEFIGPVPPRKFVTPKPIAGKAEKLEPIVLVKGGFYSDGKLLIKGEPPKETELFTDKVIDFEKTKEGKRLKGKGGEPAKLKFYAIEEADMQSVSPNPLPGANPLVIFESEGKLIKFEQDRFNVLRNMFPDATYKFDENIKTLKVFQKGELVGALISRKDEIDPELINMASEAGLIAKAPKEVLPEVGIEKEPESKAQFSVDQEGYENAIRSNPVGLGKKPKIVPPLTATKQTIEWEKTEPWRVNRGRNIEGVFEREVGPKLQVSNRFKKWLGAYYTLLGESGTIRVKSLGDLQTLFHETGHFLDDVLGKFPISRERAVRDKLLELSKEIRPFEESVAGKKFTQYRRSRNELFADFVAMFVEKPERAREVIPDFTRIVEEEIAKDKEFKYVIDKLREVKTAFEPLLDFVKTLRTIPEIEPDLKDWEAKGTFVNQIWRKSIGDRIFSYIENGAKRLLKLPIVRTFDEKRGLDDIVYEIVRQRGKMIDGQRTRLKKLVTEKIDVLNSADKQYIAESLQRFDDIKKTDHRLSQITEDARKELAVWGNEARRLKLLNDGVFWNNVGQYFPFFYSTKEFADNRASFGYFPAAKLKTVFAGLKHRLSDEEMGERVLEAQFGTFPSGKKKIAGFTKEQKEAIGVNARTEMGLMKEATYPIQKRLSQMIEMVYTVKSMNTIAAIPGIVGKKGMAGYLQMPEGRKYGDLSGQYVPESLVKEVVRWTEFPSELMETVRTVNGVWKNFKVSWDPNAIIRNIVNNVVMGYLNGVPIYNPKVFYSGVRSFFTENETYKALRDEGLYNHTYSREELQKLAVKMDELESNSIKSVLEWAVETFKVPAKAYGAVEDIFKTIGAKYSIENGASVKQAVKFADKVWFDYTETSEAVAGLRNFMIPFITWSSKAGPLLMENAIKNPERFLVLAAIIESYNWTSRKNLGISEEEEKAVKPDFLKNKTVLLLPHKDKEGRLNWVDISYHLPWDNFIPLEGGKLAPPSFVKIGNPFFALNDVYVTNFDSFRKKEIAPTFLPESERRRLQKQYLIENLGPRILSRTPNEIVKSLKSIKDKEGISKELSDILMAEFLAIRKYPSIELKLPRLLKFEKGQRGRAKSYIIGLLKSGEISKEQAVKLMKEANEQYKEKVMEKIAPSRIPPPIPRLQEEEPSGE